MIYEKKFISESSESFSAEKALKGITLASKKVTESEGESTTELLSVENFKPEAGGYSAIVNGEKHFFNHAGKCTDDNNVGDLAFVKGDIGKDTSNAAAAADEEEGSDVKATISSLNPRDYFAQEVMNGFMKNVDKPFSMSDADIYKYSTLAYKIAQSMINVSADNREADPESDQIEVDAKTLNGNTEKLLNNISVSLNTMAEASEGGGGGGESTFDGNITGWPLNSNLSILLGTGPGTSELNPIYTSGSWPTRSALIGILAGDVDSFLVFKGAAPAYFTFSNLKGAISNYLEDSTSSGGLNSLTSAVLGKLTPADIFNKMENDTANVHLIKALVDSRIKQFAADLKTANPSITIPSDWTT